jgi:cytochrome P450
MALTATSLAALGLLVLLFLQLRPRSVKVPKGLRLPPAPRGLPLLGNTLQLEHHPKHQLRQWARTLGDVFSLKIGGYNFVLLCSPEAIKGIMDKQAAATSSRPPFPASHQAAAGGMRTLLMEYNPRWRKLRTIVHKLTTPKVSDSMRPSQEFEAKQLAYDILTDNARGDNFYTHCRRYTTSVVMTATYGKRVPTWVSH